MHTPRVEGTRTPKAIELRDSLEGEQVDDGARHHFRDGRTAGNVDDRLARDQLVDRRRAGRIGLCALYATVRRAAAPCHDGLRAFSGLPQDVERGTAADAAVDAVGFRRHRPLDEHEVLALVAVHRGVQCRLGLVAGSGLQRLGVVERELVQDDVGDDRMRRPEERLAAAGALLEVEPDHRQPRLPVERLDHARRAAGLDACGCGHPAAELQEVAPRVALHPGVLPDGDGCPAHDVLLHRPDRQRGLWMERMRRSS